MREGGNPAKGKMKASGIRRFNLESAESKLQARQQQDKKQNGGINPPV
jgi:hypothetical protein